MTAAFLEPALPFSPEMNPHVESARRHLDHWVREWSLLPGASMRRRFDRADFAGFAARTYPTADEAGLHLISDWFAWLFVLDDQLDDADLGRDLPRVAALKSELGAVMTGHRSKDGGRSAAGPAGRWPIVRALADLWRRMDARTTAVWRARFVGHVAAGAMAAQWEAENRVRGHIADEATYIAQRRHTGAIYVCMDLIEVVADLDVPPALYDDPLFQEILTAACDVVCWTNDVYSLDKESARGEHHNLVRVVQQSRRLDRGEALAHVVAAIGTEVRRFLDLEPRLLAAVGDDRPVAEKYLSGMRSWMRGNLDWSQSTHRYREGQWQDAVED